MAHPSDTKFWVLSRKNLFDNLIRMGSPKPTTDISIFSTQSVSRRSQKMTSPWHLEVRLIFRVWFPNNNSEIVWARPWSWRDSLHTYNYPRSLILSSRGQTQNLNSIFVNNFHAVNLKSWSSFCVPWNRCVNSGIFLFFKMCVFSACWCSTSKTIINVKNRFGIAYQQRQIPRMLLRHRLMRIGFPSSIFLICEESLVVSFPKPSGRPLEFGQENSLLVVSLPSTFALFFFEVFVSVGSGRFLDTHQTLQCRYRADLRSGWFETRVLFSKSPHWSVRFLCFASISYNADSTHGYLWKSGDQLLRKVAPSMRLRNLMFPLVCSKGLRTTCFRLLVLRMSNDLERISPRNYSFVRNFPRRFSEFPLLVQSMSLRRSHEDDSILQFFWLKTLTPQIIQDFLEHFQLGTPWKNHPRELNRLQIFFQQNELFCWFFWSWFFFPISWSLPNVTFALVHVITWSCMSVYLCHEKMSNELWIHLESLHPSSTFDWHWTNSETPWRLHSCRLMFLM